MTWLRPIDRWFAEEVFVYNRQHRSYALRLSRDAAAAEDLVQEAYARLFRMNNWADISSPHAFTMRIIHNQAMENFRRADVVSIEQGATLHALDPVDESPGPDVATIARAELRRVHHAIESLPERSRDAVKLRRIEGLKPKDVAEKMGISVSTMEKHLTKGLRLLFDRLAQQDEDGLNSLDRAGQKEEWNQRRRHEQQ